MQISHPGSLTLEPTLLQYKGLLFMHFSSGFSLRSFPQEMSCELGFSCGVAPAPTETGPTLTGSMAQNKSCLNQRREKCYSAKPFPPWHPWCISNKNQEPTSHPSPTQKVSSVSHPSNWGHVLLCKQSWWEMVDGPSPLKLGKWGKRGRGGGWAFSFSYVNNSKWLRARSGWQ